MEGHWVTIALLVLFVGYGAFGAVVNSTHNGKHYRWCAAVVHYCTGVQH